MNKPLSLALALCCLLALLLFPTHLLAQALDDDEGIEPENQVGGALYAGKSDAACETINKQAAKASGQWPLMAYAFFDPDSNATLCLNIMMGDSVSPRDMTYHITKLDGALLEALSAPMTSSGTPLEGCNIWDVYFDDYNQDRIADITLMIGCAPPGDGNVGQNDNVVYLSVISEDLVWLRQRKELNKAIATYVEYSDAEPVIRAVLSGKSYPKPPSTPPPPPSSPPPPGAKAVDSGICYVTDSGRMMLYFDNATEAVTGTFGQYGGTLAGIRDGIQSRGVWIQGNERGDFVFTHETWGFWGHWKYSADSDWRGEWEGKVVQCD